VTLNTIHAVLGKKQSRGIIQTRYHGKRVGVKSRSPLNSQKCCFRRSVTPARHKTIRSKVKITLNLSAAVSEENDWVRIANRNPLKRHFSL
jgi:hypothetical protein